MKPYKQNTQSNTLTDEPIPYSISKRKEYFKLLLWYRENEGKHPNMSLENVVEMYLLKNES